MGRQGLVFDIQRFSLHDGEGIRTLVFTKGCPLRCKWCSNPEGLNHHLDILWRPNKCIGCGTCKNVCPKNAVEDGSFRILRDLCRWCCECAKMCPTGAKSKCGEVKTPREIIKMVKRDMPFYKNSGGGLTMGGGEVLMQPKFTFRILQGARKEGLNTAIETCGMGKWECFDEIANHCDTIHFDIKALDKELHRELTGVSNETIIENLLALNKKIMELPSGKRPKLVIRLPLVQGHNDSPEDIDKISDFLKNNAIALSYVEILPFHNFGEKKYAELDMEYEFKSKPNAPKDAFNHLAERISSKGIPVRIANW